MPFIGHFAILNQHPVGEQAADGVKTTGRAVHFPFTLTTFLSPATSVGRAFSLCMEGGLGTAGSHLNIYSGIWFLDTNWRHSLYRAENRRLVALPGIEPGFED